MHNNYHNSLEKRERNTNYSREKRPFKERSNLSWFFKIGVGWMGKTTKTIPPTTDKWKEQSISVEMYMNLICAPKTR